MAANDNGTPRARSIDSIPEIGINNENLVNLIDQNSYPVRRTAQLSYISRRSLYF